jgi:hypothetical protein
MKKLLTILLTFAMMLAFAACIESEFETGSQIIETAQEIKTPQDEVATPSIQVTTAEVRTETPATTNVKPDDVSPESINLGDRYTDNSMKEIPNLYDNIYARNRTVSNFNTIFSSSFGCRIFEYLGHSDWSNWFTGNSSEFSFVTSLMDYGNTFSVIVKYDIPDEFVINAIEENNAMYKQWFDEGVFNCINGFPDEEMLAEILFTPADIKALLTRCEATVLAHFASPYAIVIHDRVYTPAWIYRNTVEGYRAAGITPEMLAEKLPLYTEFGFTAEATAAFENKLTAFMGTEVSFAKIARDSGVAQSRN